MFWRPTKPAVVAAKQYANEANKLWLQGIVDAAHGRVVRRKQDPESLADYAVAQETLKTLGYLAGGGFQGATDIGARQVGVQVPLLPETAELAAAGRNGLGVYLRPDGGYVIFSEPGSRAEDGGPAASATREAVDVMTLARRVGHLPLLAALRSMPLPVQQDYPVAA